MGSASSAADASSTAAASRVDDGPRVVIADMPLSQRGRWDPVTGARIHGRSMHGSHRDRQRAEAAVRLVSKKVSRAEAFWRVISDPLIGTKKDLALAQAGKRPSDAQLDRRFMALLRAAEPLQVESALAQVKTMFAASALPAAQELAKNAMRTVRSKDAAAGIGAQTKAAELLFRALGVIGGSSGTQVNTQVNVNVAGVVEAQEKAREILAGRRAIDAPVSRIEDDPIPTPAVVVQTSAPSEPSSPSRGRRVPVPK